MKQLSREEVTAQKVSELGLDPKRFDLVCKEAIAANIRRSASILCPCTPNQLVRAVVYPLKGLVDDLEGLQESVEETLEALVAHGELVEPQQVVELEGTTPKGVLYAVPPSFIFRQSGSALVLGVSTDCPSPLSGELQQFVEFVQHIRRLPSGCVKDLHGDLIRCGMVELSYKQWLRLPPKKNPDTYLREINELLDHASPSGEMQGLSILDSDKSVEYYRGRWAEPKQRSGRFVGRRRQQYGADLWCYIQLNEGRCERFVDLPVLLGRQFHARGCDEAWLLQMAIDAQRGNPQKFRVRRGTNGRSTVEFNSPVPKWTCRRWNSIGEPVSGRGYLLAYSFRDEELQEELRYCSEDLWLKQA